MGKRRSLLGGWQGVALIALATLLAPTAFQATLKEDISNSYLTYALTDTMRPSVKITSPAAGATLSGETVKISGTAYDNSGGSGVGKVEVRIDTHSYKVATPKATGDWSTWSISFSEKDTGTHILSARATD